jgi:hypothetical protein
MPDVSQIPILLFLHLLAGGIVIDSLRCRLAPTASARSTHSDALYSASGAWPPAPPYTVSASKSTTSRRGRKERVATQPSSSKTTRHHGEAAGKPRPRLRPPPPRLDRLHRRDSPSSATNYRSPSTSPRPENHCPAAEARNRGRGRKKMGPGQGSIGGWFSSRTKRFF